MVVVFQQAWKGVGRWQDARQLRVENAKDVDVKDHELLHEIADVMMDKPAGIFSRGTKGIVTRFGDLETQVSTVQNDVTAIRKLLEERK